MSELNSIISNSKKTLGALLVSVCLLILFNLVFFSSAVYSKMFLPESAAGQVMLMMRAEATRVPVNRANKTAILFGDSRLAEGFSAKIANIDSLPQGLEVVNAAIPSTTPRCWYYFLNSLDPRRDKYDYIALGIPSLSKLSSDDLQERLLDLDYIAPIAHFYDIPEVMESYSSTELRTTTIRYLALKGFVYKYDLQDFLTRPRERLKIAKGSYQGTGWAHNYEYPGRSESLAGVQWDATSQKALFPPEFSDEKKGFVRKYIEIMNQPPNGNNLKYYVYWLNKILKKYEHTKTKIIVFQMPAGPLPTTSERSILFPEIARIKQNYPLLTILPVTQFKDLEVPELFFDYLHLNSSGRRKLSKDLTASILALHQNKLKE